MDNSDAGCHSHELTEVLLKAVGKKSLWDDYGIMSDIMVCGFFLLSALHLTFY